MLQITPPVSADARLHREAWHHPLVSIIITHFNYSSHIGDALLSILDQTHGNWECVIVDDASSPEHKERLDEIVATLNCDKIKIIWLPENVGQIPAFFAGLDATRGEFVCPLDPDDRYTKTFLAETVAAHLNNTIACPIVCTDQYTLVDGQVTTAAYTRHRINQLGHINQVLRIDNDEPHLLYIPAKLQGWHWASTSCFMFRRAALKYVRPHKKLTYKRSVDAYLAIGTHLLGGTVFLTKPLVYRTLHDNNSFITANFYSTLQKRERDGAENWSLQCRSDVLEALQYHGASIMASGETSRKSKHIFARWKRSLAKRIRNLPALRTASRR